MDILLKILLIWVLVMAWIEIRHQADLYNIVDKAFHDLVDMIEKKCK